MRGYSIRKVCRPSWRIDSSRDKAFPANLSRSQSVMNRHILQVVTQCNLLNIYQQDTIYTYYVYCSYYPYYCYYYGNAPRAKTSSWEFARTVGMLKYQIVVFNRAPYIPRVQVPIGHRVFFTILIVGQPRFQFQSTATAVCMKRNTCLASSRKHIFKEK